MTPAGHYLNHPGVLAAPEMQYHHLLAELLELGDHRMDRTGTGASSVFGRQMRFDLSQGFPLFTSKFLPFKVIAKELLWFLSGSTSNLDLNAMGVTIWDEWAGPDGELGPVYGKQWRSWSGFTPDMKFREVDQIAELIKGIRENPYGRRHIVSAWNPLDIPDMALPPCHCLFQFFVSSDGKLSCQLYQRSADAFLGLPFNVASYALLTEMVAHACGLRVGEFVWTGGDVHLYDNHRNQADLLLERQPYPEPRLAITHHAPPASSDLYGWAVTDFILNDYKSHPHIPAPVAK